MTRMRALNFLLALALTAGDVSAKMVPTNDGKAALLPPRLSAQLNIRGGAGPLDPTMVAKTAIGVLGAQGAVAALAPEPTAKSYGNEPTPFTALMTRRCGIAALAVAVMTYGIMFEDWSMYTTAGVDSIIWCTELVRSMLNDESAALGINSDANGVWLALHLANAFVCFTDASCANTVLKVFSIFVIGTSAPLVFFPGAGLKTYGMDLDKVTDLDLAYTKAFSAWGTGIGTFLLSIANGSGPTKALGYAITPLTLLTASMLFVTKESDKTGSPKAPAFAWLVFNAIVAATLGLD